MKLTKVIKACLVVAVALAVPTVVQALPTPTVAWEGGDYNNDGSWEPTIQPAGEDFTWTGSGNGAIGGSGVAASGSTNFNQINNFVSGPGFRFNTNGGGDSFHDKLGNGPTTNNVTWELAIRPGDFQDNHHIFNTGGNGLGTGMVLLGNTLEFRFQQANNNNQRVVVAADLSAIGSASDFFHVIMTADVDSAASGTGAIYVNGALVEVETSVGTINDWDGGDLAQLGDGSVNIGNFNIPGNNPFNSTDFDGDIAFFRVYTGELFSQADVNEAFGAVHIIPEPSTALLLGLFGVAAGVKRRRKA